VSVTGAYARAGAYLTLAIKIEVLTVRYATTGEHAISRPMINQDTLDITHSQVTEPAAHAWLAFRASVMSSAPAVSFGLTGLVVKQRLRRAMTCIGPNGVCPTTIGARKFYQLTRKGTSNRGAESRRLGGAGSNDRPGYSKHNQEPACPLAEHFNRHADAASPRTPTFRGHDLEATAPQCQSSAVDAYCSVSNGLSPSMRPGVSRTDGFNGCCQDVVRGGWPTGEALVDGVVRDVGYAFPALCGEHLSLRS
jgi:hypothetical protein